MILSGFHDLVCSYPLGSIWRWVQITPHTFAFLLSTRALEVGFTSDLHRLETTSQRLLATAGGRRSEGRSLQQGFDRCTEYSWRHDDLRGRTGVYYVHLIARDCAVKKCYKNIRRTVECRSTHRLFQVVTITAAPRTPWSPRAVVDQDVKDAKNIAK